MIHPGSADVNTIQGSFLHLVSMECNRLVNKGLLYSFQKKVEEFSDDENQIKKFVTETKETVTRSSGTAAPVKSKMKNPVKALYRQLTTSDYPTIIIFTCIALITLSFVLEPYIK